MDWLFIYYAPYDNNLSHYSDSILNQLESVREFENIQVVLQVDKSDSVGMLRYAIGANATTIDTIASEESTSRKSLQAYLRWASETYKFKQSAVFFLDHGGGLNEVGQDLNPDSTFLTTRSIRKPLEKFNKWNQSKVDLIYLQVCAKSSIEPLYEFRDVSHYTLASQQLLGAPNYYYSEVIRQASQNQLTDGLELAKSIALNDREDMISKLTCVDNSQFDLIRSDFRKLTFLLEKKEQLLFKKPPLQYEYANDRYWDLVDFLNCLDLQSQSAIKLRDGLIESIENKLVAYTYTPVSSDFSGISIAALSKERIGAFWWKMQFYRDFRMNQLPIE
ncbi:MAG: hypothetical protein Crog4KO_03700 [Crocinitomicaceae bacterium]